MENKEYTGADMTLSYLAAAIDCDGSFGIIRRQQRTGCNYSYIPRMSFGQVKPDIARLFYNTFGGSLFTRVFKTSTHQKQFEWSIANKLAVVCTVKLLPYLILKRGQAELIIALGNSNGRPFSETREKSDDIEVRVTKGGEYVQWTKSKLTQDIIDEREAIFQKFRELQRNSDNRAINNQLLHPESNLPV